MSSEPQGEPTQGSETELPSAARAPAQTPARRPLRSRWVLLGLLTLFCAVLGGFWAGYRFLVYYERKAALHLPEGTEAVVRLDLEQVVLFEPFREHILGSAKRWVTVAEWTDLGKSLGINFGMDLREVLFAGQASTVTGNGHWVLVIAGLFPKTGVLADFGRWLDEHEHPGCAVEGERLSCPNHGLIAEQAADGSIVVAPNASVLAEALPPSQRYQVLGLEPGKGAIELGWRPAHALEPGAIPSWLPGATFFSEVAGLNGRVLLESDAVVQLRLSAAPGIDVQRLARSTESLKLSLQTLLAFSGPEVGGEKTLLTRATVQVDPEQPEKVLIQSVWERRDLDKAARALGDQLWSWGQNAAQVPGSP
jgi:hypothetical protein